MPLTTRPALRTEQVVAFGGMSTRAAKMRSTLASLARLAATEANLLIEGETGVGKELAAESVHRCSARQAGPFVVFDCAAQSVQAGERELFGADEEPSGMVGSLELAAGGTVLLDHIDELPRPLQVRLLRALERREIRRVGGKQNIAVDVRVIAACTRALRREVRLGTFKRELYTLVGTECVRIPPLRQRLEDLTPLAEEILTSFQPPRELHDIPDHVWAAFRAYPWPGNVRELRNALQRAVMMPDRALRFARGL